MLILEQLIDSEHIGVVDRPQQIELLKQLVIYPLFQLLFRNDFFKYFENIRFMARMSYVF